MVRNTWSLARAGERRRPRGGPTIALPRTQASDALVSGTRDPEVLAALARGALEAIANLRAEIERRWALSRRSLSS